MCNLYWLTTILILLDVSCFTFEMITIEFEFWKLTVDKYQLRKAISQLWLLDTAFPQHHTSTYLSDLPAWADKRSSWIFFVIFSVFLTTSSCVGCLSVSVAVGLARAAAPASFSVLVLPSVGAPWLPSDRPLNQATTVSEVSHLIYTVLNLISG